MKSIRKALTLILSAAAVGSFMSASVCAAKMTDIKNHWAKQYIEYGVEHSYINGYEDSTFRPEGLVTRAEFSKMINSAVGITKTSDTVFSDVEKSKWFYDDVRRAVYAGYVSGYSDGRFLPNNKISRQEAAVILYRLAVKGENKKDISTFSDGEKISDWAREAVFSIAGKGYISGDENKRFNPAQSLTRAQAAKLIYEFINNENIHSGSLKLDSTSKNTFSEVIFTDDVESSDKIVLDNCRVFGTLTITGRDTDVVLNAVVANEIILDCDGAVVEIGDDCDIKSITVLKPASITGEGTDNLILSGDELYAGTVELGGDFENVKVEKSVIIRSVDGEIENLDVNNKVNLVIQSGDIENLKVSANAKGSNITLSQNTEVSSAAVNAAVDFHGLGVIESAYNGVSGITYETEPQKVSGKDVSGEKEGELDDPTIAPSNGKTKVNTSADILVRFDSEVYNEDGEKLTATYIKNNVKLRRSTKTGTAVSYNVDISDDNKTITLEPVSTLEKSTKYFVVIDKNTFFDKSGASNDEFSSYFTTVDESVDEDSDADVTFSPKSGEKNVDRDAQIKLTFTKALYRASGSAVSDTYLNSGVIELRKGSASGTTVSFNAEISSTKKIITITPDEMLEADTRYYVIVTANAFADSQKNKIPKKTSYFNTSDALVPTITPENAATGVSTLPDITIEFDEAIVRSNGNSINSSYLMASVIELHKTKATGTDVSFVAKISSDKKTITITPDEELDKNTKYYLIINDGTIKGAKGDSVNEKITAYFTTAASMAPIVTPANGKTGVSTATDIQVYFTEPLFTKGTSTTRKPITVDYLVDNDVIELRRNTNKGALVDCDIEISSDYQTITLIPKTELISDYKYYVLVKSAKLYNESGKYNSAATTYFTTTEILTPEFDPIDGEEDVSVKVTPKVSFDETVYRPGLEELSKTYVLNNVIEFHKDNEDGETVDFTVDIDSADKTITIKPVEALEGGTDYCIVVVAGSLVNSAEAENPKAVVTFTTKDAVGTDVVITPENAQTGVSVLTEVKVAFESKIYRQGGGAVTATYAKENIELRKSSTSGTKIDCDVAVSSDGKTVTLVPKAELLQKTKYYVRVLSNKFQYIDDTKVSSKSSYFTTGDGNPTLSAFVTESVGAASAVFSAYSDTNGTLYISAKPASSNAVTDDFAVVAGKTTEVTLTGLAPKTAYTVTAYVQTAGGVKSTEVTRNITTSDAFEMSVDDVTESGAVVKVKAYEKGSLTLKFSYYDNDAKREKEVEFRTNMLLSANETKTVTLSTLLPDTDYKFTAEYICGANDDVITLTQSITTDKATDRLAINALTVKDKSGEEYEASGEGAEYSAAIGATESVQIKVEAAAGAEIKINGTVVKSGVYSAAIEVDDTTLVVPVEISYNGQKAEYTLTVSIF